MEQTTANSDAKYDAMLGPRGVSNQLSFSLYAAANRMARLHKPLLEPLGLTFSQYLVLVELLAQAPRTVGDLGTKLGMDTGTLTPILKRLSASGKVSRTRDVADERRVLVDLTEAGESIRTAVRAVRVQIKSICHLDETGSVSLKQTLDQLAWPIADIEIDAPTLDIKNKR